jgi:hypothetical protein
MNVEKKVRARYSIENHNGKSNAPLGKGETRGIPELHYLK